MDLIVVAPNEQRAAAMADEVWVCISDFMRSNVSRDDERGFVNAGNEIPEQFVRKLGVAAGRSKVVARLRW